MTVNREKMYKHIGKRIYVARRIQGITPKIIEKRTGITREELYDIETGKREISVYELFLLARCIHLSSDTLLALM